MSYSPWGHKESDTTERLTHGRNENSYKTVLCEKTASKLDLRMSKLFEQCKGNFKDYL